MTTYHFKSFYSCFVSLILILVSATWAKAQFSTPQTKNGVTVESMSLVNTEHLEFSPVYYENGIVYVTSRKEDANEDEEIDENFFELYYSELNPSGYPIFPEPFSANLNTRLHEGPVAFSSDLNTIFFTRNNFIDGKAITDDEGTVRMKIFSGTRGAKDWKDVHELTFNSNDYSCIHPTLTPDGQYLIFASNKPGGFGGYDLYVSEKEGSQWGPPVNLGPEINTSKEEAFPQYHSSGNLIFASDGHPGKGGYDLFSVKIDRFPSPPYKVINLGEPFNSTADDLGMVVHSSGNKGFFTSTRSAGHTKDDIYRFSAPNGIPGLQKEKIYKVMVQVVDKKTNQPLHGAAVRAFVLNDKEEVINEDYYDTHFNTIPSLNKRMTLEMVRRPASQMETQAVSTKSNGKIEIVLPEAGDYLLVASKEGYQTNEVKQRLPAENEVPLVVIELEERKSPVAVEPNSIEKGTVFVLDKIFYDFDKSTIRTGAVIDLEVFARKMQLYPNMEVELAAHTDSRGTSEYNLELSMKRADSAKRFLVARGIDPDRIVTKGYGESQVRNGCTDNVNCSETEHQYNRRTEITVIETGKMVEVEYLDNHPNKIDRTAQKN